MHQSLKVPTVAVADTWLRVAVPRNARRGAITQFPTARRPRDETIWMFSDSAEPDSCFASRAISAGVQMCVHAAHT